MKKIVIIEDDLTILQMYQLKFEAEGYQVYTATNGVEGLSVLHGMHTDVLLLDLMMPEMDGATMLSELRKSPWGKKIPVIILTNISRDEMPLILNKLNVTDYIIKANTTPQGVLEKVQKILAI